MKLHGGALERTGDMALRRWLILTTLASATGVLTGCTSTPAGTTPSPTPKHVTTPAPTPVPPPTATPVPSGPFAVAVTNSDRAGATYDVMLIDATGQIVARATANLPLIKPNQTIQPSLVSASDTTVYYRDGDTNIMSLTPSGATALVKSIPAGSTSIVAFSVKPDDTRLAVSLINQSANYAFSGSTGSGYVEDLADSNHHARLWSNTDGDVVRLPIGWHGSDIVDQAGSQCQGYAGNGGCGGAQSYHVIDSATGSRVATVCESPAKPPAGMYDNANPEGAPSSAGIACLESEGSSTSSAGQSSIYAVDWLGKERTFVTASNSSVLGIQVEGCYLSPDGSRMACIAFQDGALALLTPDGKTHSLGRKYTILGWIDTTHLLVDIDSTSLAVLNPDSGAVTAIPLPQADKVEMDGTLPGAL